LSETPLEWMDENEDEIWMNNQDPLWALDVCICCFSFLGAYVLLWMWCCGSSNSNPSIHPSIKKI
jgi:hypothetical protein